MQENLNENIEYENIEIENNNNSDNSNKKQTGLIIGIILAGIILLAIAVVLIITLVVKSPKARLTTAFAKFAMEYSEYQDSYMSAQEQEYILNQMYYGKMNSDMSLNITGIPNVPVTIGIDGGSARDFDAQKMSVNSQLSVMNSKITEISAYVDGTEVYFNIPLLIEETIKLDTNNLAKNLNESVLAETIGLSIPDNIDYRPFGDGEKKEITVLDMKGYFEDSKDEVALLNDNLEVTKDKDKRIVELSDGTQAECVVYHMVIGKDGITPLAQKTLDKLIEQINENVESLKLGNSVTTIAGDLAVDLEDDIKLTILVDKTGMIRSISTEEPMNINGVTVAVDSDYLGSELIFEKTKAEINIGPTDPATIDQGNSLDVLMSRISNEDYIFDWTTDADKNISANLKTSGDVDASVSFSGNMDYDAETQILTAKELDLEVSEGGNTYIVTGDMTLQVGECNVDNPPTSNVIDVLNLGLMDILNIMGQLGQKYEQLQSVAEMMGL